MSADDRSGLDWIDAVQDSLARHAEGLDEHEQGLIDMADYVGRVSGTVTNHDHELRATAERLEVIEQRLDALVKAMNLHNDALRDMRDKMAVQSAHDLP